MAAIQHRTPSWLTRGGYAAKLFLDDAQTLGADDQSQQSTNGWPHVPMAPRGNEIFYAVGQSIRWADVSALKERTELTGTQAASGPSSGYRVLNLKRTFPEPIRQLLISPNEDLMAIVTKHTVCVIILPDLSSWSGDDTTPINVRRHTIGETTHVKQTPAIAKVLWHPLGLSGHCLVTVTVSSVVRLWELDRRNLGSFSEPSLAIDLQKLRHAKSQEEDTTSRDMQYNQTFSIDNVEMEVTGACFGSNANEAQAFEWSATTLWLTMAEGDIFALCPLLPGKFRPDDDGTIPTLAEVKTAQKQSLDAEDVFGPEMARVQAQCEWLRELEEQYESFETREATSSDFRRCYFRPRSHGAIPKLQGPFVILPDEVQDDLLPCDIHVIGASTAASIANRWAQDESDEEAELGTSFSVVSILGEDGRVHVCIDIDGVEPQWLPRTKRDQAVGDSPARAELVLLEALDTLNPEDAMHEQNPAFVANSSADEYSFFVSHRKGIYKLSIDPWVHQLEKEVQATDTEGVQFRAGVLAKGNSTSRERIFRPDQRNAGKPMSKPVLLSTEELGHMLLTVQGEQAYAVVFSSPGADDEPEPAIWKSAHAVSDRYPALLQIDREAYSVPAAFEKQSNMISFLERQIEPRHKRLLKEEVRLSSATLSVMTDAHRVLSHETTTLNKAAAELFRRCDRLHEDFKHQIEVMSSIAERVRNINGTEESTSSPKPPSKKKDIEDRLIQAKERQIRILKKHSEISSKIAHAGGKALSAKERAWVAEIKKIESAVGVEDTQALTEQESGRLLQQRFEEVRDIANTIVQQAKERNEEMMEQAEGANGHSRVPPDIRRGKIMEVEELLDRETALLDAAMVKLAKLGVANEA